eukprot:553950-Pyramimonas_sp.AAC.1
MYSAMRNRSQRNRKIPRMPRAPTRAEPLVRTRTYAPRYCSYYATILTMLLSRPQGRSTGSRRRSPGRRSVRCPKGRGYQA